MDLQGSCRWNCGDLTTDTFGQLKDSIPVRAEGRGHRHTTWLNADSLSTYARYRQVTGDPPVSRYTWLLSSFWSCPCAAEDSSWSRSTRPCPAHGSFAWGAAVYQP